MSADRPKLPREAIRELCSPSAYERQKLRAKIGRSIAEGAYSATVARVDRAIAEGAPPFPAPIGAGLSLPKVPWIKLAAVLAVGAGVATWQLTLAESEAPVSVVPSSVTSGPALPLERAAEDSNMDRYTVVHPERARPLPPTTAEPSHARASHIKQHQRGASSAEATHAGHSTHASHAARHEPVSEQPTSAPLAAFPSDPEPPKAPPSHHLAEELRLMRTASAAVAAEDWPRARQLLKEHASRFSDGALARERRGLQLILDCKRGATAAVHAERDAMLAGEADSPLTARIREACEGVR